MTVLRPWAATGGLVGRPVIAPASLRCRRSRSSRGTSRRSCGTPGGRSPAGRLGTRRSVIYNYKCWEGGFSWYVATI